MNPDEIPDPEEFRRVARFLRAVLTDTMTNHTLPGATIVRPFHRGYMSAVSVCEEMARETEENNAAVNRHDKRSGKRTANRSQNCGGKESYAGH